MYCRCVFLLKRSPSPFSPRAFDLKKVYVTGFSTETGSRSFASIHNIISLSKKSSYPSDGEPHEQIGCGKIYKMVDSG